MYRELNPQRIIETSVVLHRRIGERFPESGLSRVALELVGVAKAAEAVSSWLSRPILWVRAAVAAASFVLVLALLVALSVVDLRVKGVGIFETAQGVESTVNVLVFVAVAIYFLVSLETRIKRGRALRELHVLRSLAHVVDMHQLTKDPERVSGGGPETASSPKRDLTRFELARYLDYSSEMLAILSKVAAIYVQRFNDAETTRVAGDIEDLTVGLSRNIWQKIVLLDRTADEPEIAGAGEVASGAEVEAARGVVG